MRKYLTRILTVVATVVAALTISLSSADAVGYDYCRDTGYPFGSGTCWMQ